MSRVQRHCPVCNSISQEYNALFLNHLASLDEINLSYTLASCDTCGSSFANNLAPFESYNSYYSSFSKYDLGTVVSEETQKRHLELAKFVSKVVSLKSHILDLGCGSGHLLHQLGQIGFTNLMGVEPAPNAAKVAKALYGLTNIRRGFLQDVVKMSEFQNTDVLILTAVLEHLYNPISQVGMLLELMKKGSYVAIEVPDLDAFDAHLGGPYEELSLEHINYFSIRSLSGFLSMLGYRIVESVKLSFKTTGVLLVIASKEVSKSESFSTEDSVVMKKYLKISEKIMYESLNKMIAKINRKILIYGAGSHTARLLPRLKEKIGINNILGIIDANVNLHGVKMDGIPIFSKNKLKEFPNADVLISSFRFEKEIQKSLCGFKNDCILIYSNN